MTDPDFSPVTGNRIRPVDDCQCSTCTALRAAPEAAAQIHRPVFTIDTSDEVGGLRHQLREARRERDEARKALEMSRATVKEIAAERDQAVKRSVLLQTRLAAQVEKTNECTRALNAYPGVAELAALRARVAELEAELAAARDNPLSLFDKPTHTTGSYTKQIKPGLWFVGLTVNARGSTGASTEAIKRIAGWI